MRVITEETLVAVKERFLQFGKDSNLTDSQFYEGNLCALNQLIGGYLEEIDQLTVSKLRPMSEHPEIPDGKIQIIVMVFLNYTDIPEIVSFDERKTWPHSTQHGIGWIPLPIYKPEHP